MEGRRKWCYRNGRLVAALVLSLAAPSLARAQDELAVTIQRLVAASDPPTVRIELAEDCLDRLASEPNARAEHEVRLALAIALHALERYSDATSELELAASLARDTKEDRSLAHALWLQGVGAYYLGRLDEAVAAAEEGLGAAEASSWDDVHWRLANILGLSHERRGEPEAAIAAFRRGQASAARVAETTGDSEGMMTLLGNFGMATMNLGQPAEALEIFERVLSLVRETGHSPSQAWAIANIGDALANLGRFDEARERHEEALAIRIEEGIEAELARSYFSLGCIHVELGKFETGLEELEKAREIRERLELAPDLAATLVAMSKAYAGMDQDDAALTSAQRGVELADRLALKGRRVALLEVLADVHTGQGDHERALAVLEQANELERTQRSIETQLRLGEFRAQLEASAQQQRIALLSRERELQELTLAKRHNERNALLIGGFLAALAAAAGWYAWASLRRAVRRIQKLEQERARAEHLESLGVLAGGIAHDFNNILTVILGNASLLRSAKSEGDPASELLDAVEDGVERGTRLSGQLLSLAEGGTFARELSAVGPIVQESTHFALSGSASRATFDIDPELWHGEVDPGQLQQLLSNVVLNADQSMPAGGQIEVRAHNIRLEDATKHGLVAGPYVCITIDDHGCGIDPEIRDRIFEPYFTTKDRGNGLGLAISYAIVQRHGGSIDSAPRPAGGTRVEILLPAVPDALPPAQPAPVRPRRGEGRVLAMDDERSLRDLYGSALTRLGYECTTAPDGVRALDLARTALEEGRPFEVAILDLTVPGGMGGVEAVRELHALDPNLQVIVASGYANNDALEDPTAFGFKGVLRKPFATSALSTAVSRALKARRAVAGESRERAQRS